MARIADRWMRALVVSWALVGIGVLLVAVGWLIGKVWTALVPFGLALVLVYLLRGLVDVLERRGMKRGLAVGVCYLVGVGLLSGIFAFIIPPLVEQVRQFVEAFPGYYEQASELLLDLQGRYEALVMPPWFEEALVNLQDTLVRQSTEWSRLLAQEIFSIGGAAMQLLATSVLSLVVGFWILKDLPTIKQEMLALAGPGRRDEAVIVIGKVSRVLSGYLRGQLVLSLSTGIIVAIGLTIFGVPYSLVIGLLAAILNVIPWVGPALTAVIAAIAAAFVNPWLAFAGIGVSVGAQQITEIFVQPRVMSSQVDLHPLLVIFSLLSGAALFGFVGLLLAIPVAAIAKGLFVYYFEKHTDAKLTSEEGALFRSRRAADAVECEQETADDCESVAADQGTAAADERERSETHEERT
jgi:predicted PurR-regulated permease PerM